MHGAKQIIIIHCMQRYYTNIELKSCAFLKYSMPLFIVQHVVEYNNDETSLCLLCYKKSHRGVLSQVSTGRDLPTGPLVWSLVKIAMDQ